MELCTQFDQKPGARPGFFYAGVKERDNEKHGQKSLGRFHIIDLYRKSRLTPADTMVYNNLASVSRLTVIIDKYFYSYLQPRYQG